MLRQVLCSAARFATISIRTPSCKGLLPNVGRESLVKPIARNFTSILNNDQNVACKLLFNNTPTPKPQVINITSRTVTKYSMRKGKRKSVKAVLRRFYRLSWGGWIRTKAGRQKKLWKKNPPQKRRLRQHVFCNSTQSRMLDKMVGPYWRKRKYYVDDHYEPYHSKEEWQFARSKPRPYFPPEEKVL